MDKISLLIADDHAIVRAGMRKMVEEMPGLEVVADVGNGPQLFAALERLPVDFLLIDVNMPDFEPLTAIQRIRQQYPRLKILVVSAYDDDVYVQGLLGAGVHGYHLKDQPLNDLKIAIQRVLAGDTWLSPPLINKLVGKTQSAAPVFSLTNRQRELLRLLQKGLDNQTIAQEMGLSIKTVENHLTRLYRQLNVQSRLEAVHYISRHPQILGSPGYQVVAEEASPKVAAVQHCLTVLIVDDNDRYRRQLQRTLGRICPQATFYEAENIQTATHLAQRLSPQLVLIDVVLGEENGITCTRRVKAVSPRSRIILISAYPDREFHLQGLQAGAVAFLDKKDLNLSTLRQVIEDIPGK